MSPNEYLRQPYARIVIPSEGGYHAEILEFPGCYSQGDTVDEAYRNLENAALGWVDACLSQGQDVPSPFSNTGFSGKIALRLPRSIHRQASRMAERDGSSLNQFLLSAIACRVGAEDLYTLMAQRFERRVAQTAAHAFYAVSDYLAKVGTEHGELQVMPSAPVKYPETASTQAR